MYALFLIGNIASGKSTAARYLESRGARRIDLDAMAKSLYVPESQLVQDLATVFGWDILACDGSIRTGVLAERAFSTTEQTARLNAIVHPVLLDKLSNVLLSANCCSKLVPDIPLTVVEVSAAAAFQDAFGLADEMIAVTAPLDVRRVRAMERGMSEEDFDRRSEVQPSEDELCAMADQVIDNTVADDGLFHVLDAWAAARNIQLDGAGAVAHA